MWRHIPLPTQERRKQCFEATRLVNKRQMAEKIS
jgi:hypothetical protein